MKLIPRIKLRLRLLANDWSVYLRGYNSFTKMNLGSARLRFRGYLSSDISNRSTLRHDARTPFPLNDNSFEIVWSERMLEHLSVQDIDKVTGNVAKLLKPGGKFRLCMPLSYYVDDENINMMRAGNYEKQVRLGHITWFTYEGVGAVSKELFGITEAPKPDMTLRELMNKHGMELHLIRWFDSSNELHFDNELLSGELAATFIDEPEIRISRPNSLIFEGRKL